MTSMAIGLVPGLRAELTLSPQMQLAVKVLAFAREDLHAFMREAAVGNPLLRVPEAPPTAAAMRRRIRRMERGSGVRHAGDEEPAWERSLARADTLSEHLLGQLATSGLVGAELRFATLVIGNLDVRGWLDLSMEAAPDGVARPDLTLADLAAEAGLDPEDAEEVLAVVQRLDPVGVGARDLAECLRVQGEERGFGELELTVIREHLARVERGQHDAIARAMGVDVGAVREAIDDILTLEPRPARAFGGDASAPSVRDPEVAIRKVDGEYAVIDLVVNPYGVGEAPAEYAADRTAKRFLSRCRREADMLITALERRTNMVLLVAREVLRHQRAFFDHGPRALRPLTMQQVADALDVHESTVSRAVADKSVDTPRGVYDLRYFFRAGVASERGDAVSNEAAREALRAIVASEDARHPLSDAELARQLAARDGVRVARRTVTKYREMLGIASSQQRARHT